jgi:hypothetical protein
MDSEFFKSVKLDSESVSESSESKINSMFFHDLPVIDIDRILKKTNLKIMEGNDLERNSSDRTVTEY